MGFITNIINTQMKNTNKKQSIIKDSKPNADHTRLDADADKTGTDANSDCTEKVKEANKFDKPRRERDPDTTGIDVNSDKTKRQKPQNKQKTSKK